MPEQPKMVNLAVTCWRCHMPIGMVLVREDMLAIPKPGEGQPLSDHMLTGMLNGLFNALTTASPGSFGLTCPDCLAKLRDQQG